MSLISIMSLTDWLALFVFLICYIGYQMVYSILDEKLDLRLRSDMYRELIETAGQDTADQEGTRLIAQAFNAYARMFVFLGTISFLALGGALGLFLSTERVRQLLNFSLFERIESLEAVRFRLVIFIILAGYAFLQFIWGIKALYTLSLSVHGYDPDQTRRFLNHMHVDFTSGIRTLYFLSVLFLWFFGPEFLIIGCVGLTFMLYRYDFLKTKY